MCHSRANGLAQLSLADVTFAHVSHMWETHERRSFPRVPFQRGHISEWDKRARDSSASVTLENGTHQREDISAPDISARVITASKYIFLKVVCTQLLQESFFLIKLSFLSFIYFFFTTFLCLQNVHIFN